MKIFLFLFRGPSLEDPDAYLDFVNETIDSGRKYIILDNFGAYQDRRSGEWLASGRINLTLSRLGLAYWGDWTDRPELIEVATLDPRVIDASALNTDRGPSLYYRFLAVDAGASIHLAVTRSDTDAAPSPVVITNSSGGFVLTSYLFRSTESERSLASSSDGLSWF